MSSLGRNSDCELSHVDAALFSPIGRMRPSAGVDHFTQVQRFIGRSTDLGI